jgi:hypothetical protein
MAINFTNYHQGPGKSWINCQIPATGSRLLVDINGNPTQGSALFASATEGATVLSMTPKLEPQGADQVSSPIGVVATGDAYEIDMEVKQSDLNLLRNYFPLGTFAAGTDAGLPAGFQQYEEISFGGIIPIPQTCIAVISQRKDNANKFVVSVLYNAYQAEAIKLPFERGKLTMYKVKFMGLSDASRPNTDQVGKIYRQL